MNDVPDAILQKLSTSDLQALTDGRMDALSQTGLRLLANGMPKFQYGKTDALLQGLTFNFSDEAGAAKDAILGRGGYSENLADRRTAKELFDRKNPWAAMGMELAGAGLTSLIPGAGIANVGKIAKMTPGMARAASGVASGAGFGAVAGAGNAEEGERTMGAVKGGAGGAVMGGVTSAAMNVLGAAQRAGKAMIAPAVEAVAPNTAAKSYGKAAEKKLLQALKQDRLTPQQVAKVPLDPARPETIIERAGRARGGSDGLAPNVTGLADSSIRYPGPQRTIAADLISERMGGQTGRISGDLGRAFNSAGGDALQMADDLVRQRAAAAAPLYQQAFAHPNAQAIADPEVARIANLPAFQKAYGIARRLAKYDGVELPKDPRKLEAFDLRTLDYMKRGVDDHLYSGKIKGSIGRTEAGKVQEARTQLMQRLDALVPEYAQARAAFAGPTAMKEALEDGVSMFSRDLKATDIRRRMQGMSPSELEQFKIGALEGMRSAMSRAGDGQDRVRIIFGSPDKRAILQELLSPDEYQTLTANMGRERVIRRVDDKLRGGSQTAERMAGMEDVGIAPTLQAIRSGSATSAAIDYALRSMKGESRPTAEALGPMLFATDPAAQAKLLHRLTTLDHRMMRRAGVTGSVGGGLGAYSLLDD